MTVSEYLIKNFPLAYREYSKWIKEKIVLGETIYTIACFLWDNNYHVDCGHNIKDVEFALKLFESNLKEKGN